MIEISKTVYETFLDSVVKDGVFSDAQRTIGAGRPLGDQRKKDIERGDRIDFRAPFLTTISGKGGWTSSSNEFRNRRPFKNVSLIDHLASVVRGAIVFAEIDLRNSSVPTNKIETRLARIAAIAFLHDADKVMQKNRLEELLSSDISELMVRYQVRDFLSIFDQTIDAERMIMMVDQVELTRAGRMRPRGPVLSLDEIQDCAYVTLADRLDSAFLDTRRGIKAVVDELRDFDGFRSNLLHEWRHLRITSPHTPFLLDELQAQFSVMCENRHGHPPLIEIAHDGELLLIAPLEDFEDVFSEAISALANTFKMAIRVEISARGIPAILDGGGDVTDLQVYLQDNSSVVSRVLIVSIDLLKDDDNRTPAIKENIDSLFLEFNLAPQWPDLTTASKRLVALWPANAIAHDQTISSLAVNAATIAVALGCKAPKPSSELKPSNANDREQELLRLLQRKGSPAPAWLQTIDHNISRRSLLSVWVAALAMNNSHMEKELLEKGGLVDLWLRGNDDRLGLLNKIGDPSIVIVEAVQRWFHTATNRRLTLAEAEKKSGRCHFTNAPASQSDRIDMSTDLYGIKVSAFSGREGRPESFCSMKAETLVSPLMRAEHRLRSIRARRRTRGEIPVLISSPTSAGLFASLVYDYDSDPPEISLFDAARVDSSNPGDKPVFRDVENFSRRFRIGRYDSLPSRTISSDRKPGLLRFVRMVFEIAQRTGRPLHVFRGLPNPEQAFVSFDFLPGYLVSALGGTSFRLEEIPSRIALLSIVENVASTNGMGLELAARFADPVTRFAAICDALRRLEHMETTKAEHMDRLRYSLLNQLEDEQTMPTHRDHVIVRFGEAMARVQRGPIRSDGSTVPEAGLRVALEAVEAAISLGQTSVQSLVYAIEGSLQRELQRKQLLSSKHTREETDLSLSSAIHNAAEIFVQEVWPDAFGKTSPTSKKRRTALAIYRVSFERAAHTARSSKKQPNEPDSNASEVEGGSHHES